MNKTALQQAIEKLKADKAHLISGISGMPEVPAMTGRLIGLLDEQIQEMESFLPTERQQLEDAYNKGFDNRAKGFHDTASTYYTTTYKTT